MVKGKPPAFQFYAKEWLSSTTTRRMSGSERGIYVEMLVRQFEDGYVTDDPDDFAAISSLDLEEVRAAWPTVRQCFDQTGGVLINRRMRKQRKEQEDFRSRMKKISAKGVEARQGRRPAKRNTEKDMDCVPNGIPCGKQERVTSASASASKNLAPPTPPRLEQGAARAEATTKIEALFRDMGERQHPRSTSIPKEAHVQHGEAFDWLIRYFPEQSPGAGAPPAVRVWTGRIPSHRIVSAKRELEAGEYESNGRGVVSWTKLEDDDRRRIITATLNGML